MYEFDDFRLEAGPRLLSRNGEELPLTPKAVATLCVLAEKSGQVVSKDELIRRIWPDTVVEESNLSQYLHQLRKALGEMPDGRPYIETLKRRGYRFNGTLRSRNGHAEPASHLAGARPAPDPPASGKTSRVPFLMGVAALFALFLVAFLVYRQPVPGSDGSPTGAADVIIAPLTSGENVTQATISHDGQHFVYSDFDGDRSRLILQAVDRSSRSDILPPRPGKIENLSFSPNDRQIFFVLTGTRNENGLYRLALDGGTATRILDTATSPVSFSADGSQIVFVRVNPNGNGHEQIVQASSDGSREQVLVEARDDQRISPDAALSHNGQFVVFGSIRQGFPTICSLTKVNLNDRTVSPLTSEQWDSCYRIAFTRDDSGIAFVGTRHNEAFSTRRDQVYYLELGRTESKRLTADGNWHDPMSLGITDRDEIIALPMNRISQLWTVDPDGSLTTAEQITEGQADGRSGIVPRPDGKLNFLARDGDGFALFETNADGTGRRRVFGAPTMQELRSAPQADFLIYAEQQDDRTQLFRIDTNGGERRQLTFGDSSKIDSSVSPDGKWIVYEDTAFDGAKVVFTLQRIAAQGGPPQLVSNEQCDVPHFSNDGKLISCSSDGRIRILSADSGWLIRELVPEESFVSNSGARWSPDDKYLVYRVVKNGATNLWRQPVGGGKAEPLTRFPKGDLYNFAYAADGKKLYLSRGTQIRNAILIRGYR